MNITGNACALLRDTSIEEPDAGTTCTSALHASGESRSDRIRSPTLRSCSVQLERCSVSHQTSLRRERGSALERPISVSVVHGAAVAMHLCRIHQIDQHAWPEGTHESLPTAVAITGGSRVCMTHSHVSTSGACAMCDHSTLRAADCRLVMAGAAEGVCAGASSVALVDTLLEESDSWPRAALPQAVVCASPGTTLRLLRSSFSGSREFAIMQSGSVTAVDCSFEWLARADDDHASSDGRCGASSSGDALLLTESSVDLRGGPSDRLCDRSFHVDGGGAELVPPQGRVHGYDVLRLPGGGQG